MRGGRFLFAEPPVQFVRVSVTLITSALYGVRRFSYSLTVCVFAFDMRGRFLFGELPVQGVRVGFVFRA